MNVPQLRFDGFDGEWQELSLGDHVEFKNGLNYLKSDRGESVYTVGVKNFNQKKLKSTIELEKINLSSIPNKDFLLKNDDLLFVRSNGNKELVGRMMLIENELTNTYYSGFVIRGRIKEQGALEPLFLLSLESKIKKAMKTLTGGTNISNLSQSILNSLVLNVPSIREQQKIASFLTLVEQKIEKQQEKIVKLEQLKKGMMQKIFSQELRFKDGDGGEFGEWEIKKLKNFATKIVKKNKGSQITNVISNSAKQGLISQRSYFKKDIANVLNINGYYVISKGDFVYNPRVSSESPYGPVHVYELEEDGIVSPLYLCFKTNDINSKFLKYFFSSSLWHKHVYTHGDSGARHDRVSIKDAAFFEMILAIPKLKEQEKISRFLDTLNFKFEKEKEKLMALEEQKKGFMQGMFL